MRHSAREITLFADDALGVSRRATLALRGGDI